MNKVKKALVGLVLVGIASAWLCQGINELKESRTLKANAQTVGGKVVNERTTYQRRGGTRYYLTAEWETKAGKVTRELSVSRSIHYRGSSSGTVQVHYLPGNPDVCQFGPRVELQTENVILGSLALLGSLVLSVYIWRPTSRKELADQVSGHFDRLCNVEVDYVPVDARQFSHLDIGFYDGSQRRFEERGYRFLEDVELILGKPIPNFARTFIRMLVSADGTRVGTIFHLKPNWKLRLLGAKEARTYGVGSSLSDRSSLDTDNAEAVNMLDPVPGFDELHLPNASSLEMVIDAHEHRLAARLNQQPGLVPIRIQGAEELHRILREQQVRKAEHRRQAGMSKESLERLGGVKDNQVITNLHLDLQRRGQGQKDNAA